MVELFSDNQTGSGQIRPSELPKFVDMRGPQKADLVVVKRLCSLPSYDVCSLRIALKELGIGVEGDASLCVSPGCARQLSEFVGRYTRPMLESIHGSLPARAEFIRHEIRPGMDLLAQMGAAPEPAAA